MSIDPRLARLMRWAADGESTGRRAEGPFVAVVETSEDGATRHTLITEGGEPRLESFSATSEAVRPAFYPDDLPFVPGTSVAVSPKMAAWTLEQPRAGDYLDGFTDAMQELRKRPVFDQLTSIWKDVSEGAESRADMARKGMERLAGLGADSMDTIQELFGGFFGDTGAGQDVLDAVVSFHEERGWVADSATDGGMGQRRRLTRDGVERVVHRMSMPMSTSVMLSLEPDDG